MSGSPPPTPFSRVSLYAALAGTGCLLAVVAGRPALVGASAPFAVAAVVGFGLARRPAVRAEVRVAEGIALEGDTFEVEVRVEADSGASRIEIALLLPPGLTLAAGSGESSACAFRIRPDQPRVVGFAVRAERWGAHRVGAVAIRVLTPTGHGSWQVQLPAQHIVRVYPGPERIRQLVRPFRTLPQTGGQTARVRAEGVEFADLRPYQAGDRWRDVNWRATARRGEPWVNQRHPDRNAEVVVFVDLFSADAVERAVRVAATVVQAHLAERDRVGLVAYGGAFRWIYAGSGIRQRYQLLDALIDSEAIFTYAGRDVALVPARMLAPGSLLIAVTPLEDRRSIDAVAGLRGRAVDVAVLEVETTDLLPAPAERAALGRRLWELEREAARLRYRRLGIPVATWRPGVDLGAALAELRTWRRKATRVG